MFRYNKVINEYEFPPLGVLHFLMISLRLGRHFKGEYRLTKRSDTARYFGHSHRAHSNWREKGGVCFPLEFRGGLFSCSPLLWLRSIA